MSFSKMGWKAFALICVGLTLLMNLMILGEVFSPTIMFLSTTAVGFIFIVIFVFNRAVRDKTLQENVIRLLIVLLLATLMINFANYAMKKSINTETRLPDTENKFKLNLKPAEQMFVNQAHFQYNFSSKEGSSDKGALEFIIGQKTNTSEVSMALYAPKGIHAVKARLYDDPYSSEPTPLIEGQNYTVESGNCNCIFISSINRSFDDVRVTLEMTGNLIPNGYFDFTTDAKAIRPRGANFWSMDLGRYKCSNNCFSAYINVKQIVEVTGDRRLQIYETYPTDRDAGPWQESFTLNTEDTELLQNHDIGLNIAIGLFVAWVGFLAEAIREMLLLFFAR